MRQYALVTDIVNGSSNYGVVIRENGLTLCKGVEGVGTEWAESFNNAETKSLDDGLPYGVKIGAFHALTDHEAVLIEHMLEGNEVKFPDRTRLKHLESWKTNANSGLPSVSNRRLSDFGENDLQTAVDYKIRAFLSDSARASVMLKSRLERFGLDQSVIGFKSSKNDSYLNEDLSSMARGQGLLRRAILELATTKSEIQAERSEFMIEEKAIGRRIGRAVMGRGGGSGRGSRIGRRAARAMAPYDPNAVDGDMDGIVQEGTPWERPAVRVGGRGVQLTPSQQRSRSQLPDGLRSRTGGSGEDRAAARRQKLVDALEERGIDAEQRAEIEKWVYSIDGSDIDFEFEELPSPAGSSEQRGTAFGNRRYFDEDITEGIFSEGPLEGSYFKLISERDYTSDGFNDPGETLGGSDQMEVITPDGVRMDFESASWEDGMDLIDVGDGKMPTGLRSMRRRNRGEDDYPRMDPELVDRLRRERFVPETSRTGRARQNRIINTPAADGGPPPRAVRERSGRVVPEPPSRRYGLRSTTDTANRNADKQGIGTDVHTSMKANRKFLQTLAANGFVWDKKPDRSGRVRIFLPDRLADWTAEQPDSVRDRWGKFKPARQDQAAGFIHVHPGKDTPQRPENMAKRFLNTIFGDSAWDDLVTNANKPSGQRGTGRVGVVPSTVRPGTGLRSTTTRGRTRAASTERTATPSVTSRSGLRSRSRIGTPGRKKRQGDGEIWAQLDTEQHSLIAEKARERETQLFRTLTNDSRMRKFRTQMERDGAFDNMTTEERKRVPMDRDLIAPAQVEIDDLLRNGEITAETHSKWQRILDDMKTLRNMRDDDNYELLEHLHPTSRSNIINGARKDDKTIPGPRALRADGPSTFFDTSAAKTVTGRSAGKNRAGGKRKRPLADRILTPNIERMQRRAARRQRASAIRRGGLVRGQEADVSASQSARRKLARQLRRARRKLKGQRDEKTIRKAFDAKRTKHPLSRDKDGAPVVDDNFVKFAAFVGTNIDKRERGELSEEARDGVLRDLWMNSQFNSKPEIISEDEMQALADAGWTPVHRGVGRDGQKAVAFTDSYKEDDDRFTPGEGGRAHGVGEYWATQNSGHWGGYGDGMLAYIDPEGRKISNTELATTSRDSRPLFDAMQEIVDEVGGDDLARMEDPANFVDQVVERLKAQGLEGIMDKNEIGQVMRQMLDQYKELKPDSNMRDNYWNAIRYLMAQSRQAQWRGGEGYWAPLLGYDYIDSNGVILVHNRGSVAVLDTDPLSGGAASAILKGINAD